MPPERPLRRSRTGCLTCRIRRKKCDEPSDRNVSCGTCSRLSLQCLGYAAKRPQWMQDTQKVEACKREIRLWVSDRGRSSRSNQRLSFDKYCADEYPSISLSSIHSNRRTSDWDDSDDEIPNSAMITPPLSPVPVTANARHHLNAVANHAYLSIFLKGMLMDASVFKIEGNGCLTKEVPRYLEELDMTRFFAAVQDVTRDMQGIRDLNAIVDDEEISFPPFLHAAHEFPRDDKGDEVKSIHHCPSTEALTRSLAPAFGLSYLLLTEAPEGWTSLLRTVCLWVEYEHKHRNPVTLIFETIVWLDIISSTSLHRSPILFHLYPRLLLGDKEETSLNRVMGCDRRLLVGIAHVADLAQWKDEQLSQGSLDTYALSDRSQYIRQNFLSDYDDISSSMDDVFRSACRVYLHCVALGSLPDSPPIVSAVEEAITRMKAMFQAPSSTQEGPRSLVLFSVFVTACVARNDVQKQYLATLLKSLGTAQQLGHGLRALKLVREVWRRRETAQYRERNVEDWWNVMEEARLSILLA